MRSQLFCFFLILSSLAFAQPKAKNFSNMLVFYDDAQDPYIELWYTGNFRRLESEIQKIYMGDNNNKLSFIEDSSLQVLKAVSIPVLTGSEYSLSLQITETNRKGKLIHFRLFNKNPEFNLLNSRMGLFRTNMALIQDAVDKSLNVNYYSEDQNAEIMYLYTPKKIDQNLYSYLFMYSKDDIDSTMKNLSEWFVLSCETPQSGYWLNDSTFRVDDLKQIAFGYNESFSLTIEHSLVQKGYHQYIIYLNNFNEERPENNYEIRLHDVHIRLWRFYNTLLSISKS